MAFTPARERPEEARPLHEQKCEDTAEAESIFNGAIKDTFEKAEALEKHIKTVAVRVESLATTEADFFKTLLDRQEEAQRHLNGLAAQLCQKRTTSTRALNFALLMFSRAHTKRSVFLSSISDE